MSQFPIEKLVPLAGIIRFEADEAFIEIPIQPFALELSEDDIPAVIQTSIRLDFIDFGGLSFEQLSDRTFRFPVNPEDGYIDGSVYIQHAHHPVDVTQVLFGRVEGDSIPVSLEIALILEYAGLDEYTNCHWTCATELMRNKN